MVYNFRVFMFQWNKQISLRIYLSLLISDMPSLKTVSVRNLCIPRNRTFKNTRWGFRKSCPQVPVLLHYVPLELHVYMLILAVCYNRVCKQSENYLVFNIKARIIQLEYPPHLSRTFIQRICYVW